MQNDRQITISVGASRKATVWQAQTLLLSELYEKLRVPARGSETLAEYLGLPKSKQDDLKDVGGFVAGALTGTRRKAGAVAGRDVITLDLDSIPAGQTQTVAARVEALGCGYCIYSTRKHHPAAPRLRVLLPLNRTCTADEYEPIARRAAQYIGLDYTDPTTFEASRLMYWGSCCADSEYIYYAADKPMLDADGVLATYANWRDYSSWPAIPGAVSPARLAAKQGDPLEKSGVVGAFCRVYDVPAAMDKFLPGIYEPVDHAPDRYTFTGGSTTGGAVLYDSGKFLYSHHATDPAGGKLVNAFDLVRLHCFNDLDDETKADTPTNRLPSYAAMCSLAASDETVAGLLADERWEKAQQAFGEPSSDDDDSSWRKPPIMELDAQGRPQKTMKNLHTTLRHDPRLKNRLRLNLFSGRIEVAGELPWGRPTDSAVWSDEDAAQLRIYLEPFLGKIAKQDLLDAVAACASDQAYHPIRNYLNGLLWDGAPRLDTVFIDYLGAADTPYTRAATRKSLTAAVARIMSPGCKYDTMLVLVGAQGRYKSTILAKLGGEWFSDSLRTFGDKDAMETIQGTWINEVSEMQALGKADANAVKMFLSKTSDYYRAAYGRYTTDRPRQCVFFGTTNTYDCIADDTGSRRWMCVDIDQQPRVKDVYRDFDAERDQIWAEAVFRYRMGEPLFLPADMAAESRSVQEAHRERHPWEGIVQDFLEKEIPEDWSKWDLDQRRLFWAGAVQNAGALVKRQRVCAAEVWCEALGKNRGDMRKRDAREINQLLGVLHGWRGIGVAQAGKPYGSQRCYDRIAATF